MKGGVAGRMPEQHYRLLEQMYHNAPTNRYYYPVLIVSHAAAEVRVPVRPEFMHSGHAVHGSVYFKCLDDATWFACNSVTDTFVLTHKFEIEMLWPVTKGELRAVGRLTEDGEKRLLAEGELFNEGVLVARGKGSFARSKIRLGPDVGYGSAISSKL